MSKLKGWSVASATCMLCAAAALASPAQTFSSLFSFNGSDGFNPFGTLIQASDGNLYGTTLGGGASQHSCADGAVSSCGTVFKITPNGALTIVHSFDGKDGGNPTAGLVEGADGNFYGTTGTGGPGGCFRGCGTIFKITPSGTLTTLHSFNRTDGTRPYGALVQGSDGNFYGTTSYDGANRYGTVFSITASGTLTTLHNFEGADGSYPLDALVQATDGNFYGTTSRGGADTHVCDSIGFIGCGTVFKITPSGTLTTLYSFLCSQSGCPDGAAPEAELIQAMDGNFYGTTIRGGAENYGTIFKITPGGTLTTLHSFDGTDGDYTTAGLIQAADGNFYGTSGGRPAGTVFTITPGGVLTTLFRFDGPDGSGPFAGLVQAADGTFYGTTNFGGTDLLGTVFSLSVGGAP